MSEAPLVLGGDLTAAQRANLTTAGLIRRQLNPLRPDALVLGGDCQDPDHRQSVRVILSKIALYQPDAQVPLKPCGCVR